MARNHHRSVTDHLPCTNRIIIVHCGLCCLFRLVSSNYCSPTIVITIIIINLIALPESYPINKYDLDETKHRLINYPMTEINHWHGSHHMSTNRPNESVKWSMQCSIRLKVLSRTYGSALTTILLFVWWNFNLAENSQCTINYSRPENRRE